MEENNIFRAGGDALVYLAVPMYKKHSTFVWGHPFSTYVSNDAIGGKWIKNVLKLLT